MSCNQPISTRERKAGAGGTACGVDGIQVESIVNIRQTEKTLSRKVAACTNKSVESPWTFCDMGTTLALLVGCAAASSPWC
jgi:hypothetical protein